MPSQLSVNAVIDTILQGCTPLQYVATLSSVTSLKLKPGVCVSFVEKFKGPKDTLYVLILKNETSSKQFVYENELEMARSEWIFLEKNVLEPREKIRGIVSVGKE